jgi:phosphoenolpyruvate carboxykinase (ATP)
MHTKNNVDSPFGNDELELLAQCEEKLAQERLISVDLSVVTPGANTTLRAMVPERFAHVALSASNLFQPADKGAKPDWWVLMFFDEAFEDNKEKPLPEKDITIRLALLDDRKMVKIVRNSNYTGEIKKGVFAAADWFAKQAGGIFLHVGCREDFLETPNGDYRKTRSLLAALSANGKTTNVSKILARKGREYSWLIQDDGGTLMPDGTFLGFEAGGIYVKTERVNPGSQTEIYYGLLRPDTVCENVFVSEDGDYDFYDLTRTSNGRAVIRRADFMHASPNNIVVPTIDNLILITRGPTIPAISKLSMAQAAALMVVGQAMESSAGDPTQAGRIRSEFFYDPFVAGDRAKHANLFYSILSGLPNIKCYLMNTGGVGEGPHYQDISVEHTLAILDSLLRGGLEREEDWIESPTGFLVPTAIRMVDDILVQPEKLYTADEFEKRQNEQMRVRREAIRDVGSELHPDIAGVFS